MTKQDSSQKSQKGKSFFSRIVDMFNPEGFRSEGQKPQADTSKKQKPLADTSKKQSKSTNQKVS